MKMANMSLDIKVKLNRLEIIARLGAHLDEHLIEYEKAVEVYKVDVVKLTEKLRGALDDYANAAGEDDFMDKREEKLRPVQVAYAELNSLRAPINAFEMYESFMSILKASKDDEIEFSLMDADAIINDNWSWAKDAKALNSTYAIRSMSFHE